MQSLQLNPEYAFTLEALPKAKAQVENLFVITHLGQLRQMEALIDREGLTNNGLVILYTYANLDVPQMVHDQATISLFDFLLFVEIPFKINVSSYHKLNKIDGLYRKLLRETRPKAVYLNSFEGHYVILTTQARQIGIKNILVEEGTATYKLLTASDMQVSVDKPIDYKFIKDKFMSTIGTAELFKRMVIRKKLLTETVVKTRDFYRNVVTDQRVQFKLIDVFGSSAVKSAKHPFVQFDEVYASFPDLIKNSFQAKSTKRFNIYDKINDRDLMLAQEVVEHYGIECNDVLYVSQRYGLNSREYVKGVFEILLALVDIKCQRIFIKLHPKESGDVRNLFSDLTHIFDGRVILIEDNRFLIEPVIKVSEIGTVVGLTSTTLVYAPLINEGTRSISIAKALIKKLPKSKQNISGCQTIADHLKIIEIFDSIEFV